MTTITPMAPDITGGADTAGVALTAADVIPAAAYKYVLLQIISSTGTPTVVVDDPTTPAIPGATLAANPDMTIGPLASGQTWTRLVPCARYRDASGNINLATTSFANATAKAYGIPA